LTKTQKNYALINVCQILTTKDCGLLSISALFCNLFPYSAAEALFDCSYKHANPFKIKNTAGTTPTVASREHISCL